MKKYTVMLPAAGSGRRMGAGFNKLFLQMAEKPILIHTLEVFEKDEHCSGMILSVKITEKQKIEKMLERFGITKVKALVEGGEERQHSVAACIRAHQSGGIVLVHDAARPFIDQNVIRKLVDVAAEHGAAIAGVQVKDTMKFAPDGIVEETVDRSKLWAIQTPQAFKYELLKEATDKAEVDGFLGTDESMIVERLGHPVRIVESTYDNVKMTTKEDLLFGEVLLKRRQ
ncbi:2-C-methyl-D-erythritol 4-phosphate cytidylyltransferase [Sporosarcina highlanderae]|uniref:2-C-methyl-D-erythritol 4-phosphate cytidylyltransferase n=1 Tax=Sporosarcina highlanderae TaxID=3035916 RepID=A0ABT8JPQ9_9BACL|nr:2-C-methyl-D-erythritol 4-phosphate cytidylyltransferase [Sporosarcina highlanderae]MDN4606556.1 2-C-methyl-D-erythritol 4-phosphate cytidylyltransferase [Sporosarcina highlanderae]